ncbi:cytosine permease [Streptomyces sp. Lzd4kr]|nr:cytosine permease [Streptomyces sp. Lzd4kr]
MRDKQPTGDRVGRVEVLGYDHIPLDQRHGTPRELGGVWAAAYIAPLYLLLGGILMVLGLNLWQAFLALVVGNLAYTLVAVIGTAGPRAGTPTITISRAQYGPRGNLLSAFFAWFNLVAFEALNFTVGAAALVLLLDYAGVGASTAVQGATLAVVIGGSFTLAYFGHATIVRFQKLATAILACGAFLLFVFVLDDIRWDYSPNVPLAGFSGVAVWFVALGVVISGSISWCTVPADYTRYLPPRTNPRAIVFWTTLGGFVPAVFLGMIAVFAGTAVDMSDPFAGIKEVVPGWFYVPILLVLLVGSISNNVLTIYSSSMSLQTMGLPIKRYQGVFIDGVIGSAMALYATFATDFLTALTEFLQLAVIWYAAYTAIFIADIVIRRNDYDGRQLHAGAGGRYWGRNGVHWPGITALGLAMTAGLLFANTTRFQGPLSESLSGIDLSYVVSFIVAGAAYWVLARQRGEAVSSSRPGAPDAAATAVDTPDEQQKEPQ